MSIAAIIVAGGKGLRMGAATRKQYLELAGIPILVRTLRVFLSCPQIDRIVLAAPEDDLSFIRTELLNGVTGGDRVELVAGGAERQESVYNALVTLGDSFQGLVAVHDGVRPFVSQAEIVRVVKQAELDGASILGVPAFETLKHVSEGNAITGTLSRDGIWMAQTPQVFRFPLLARAHEKAREDEVLGTDDASLVERMGEPVTVITGSRCNIKITTPDDMDLAALFLPRFPLASEG
ncbi:2-C-methyl-D-erythritol 4-phosphate cytidylyltransferase [Desulfoluna limicola]|uniref:2-C-methyl-D-erythritol 4-phosphate cytidylyltransferase n=1 Tax=Desulfoluna limicola TaxID=2810562 RepID=A0ABN6F5B3_9BACT|nr:2-C-methyl-D-erythritol 4-phosphate cytidylyltransferase [Desulfoluna limicola]BCS96855.1 2-C-methyl-D-erythritol 4-phosphate cytidylyltransferase [Desulfoluna limicola]